MIISKNMKQVRAGVAQKSHKLRVDGSTPSPAKSIIRGLKEAIEYERIRDAVDYEHDKYIDMYW